MSMKDDRHEGATLEQFFEAARASSPEPSAALLARVVAQAREVQAGIKVPPPPAHPRPALSRRLVALFGGWPTLGGLAAAAIAGLWLGAGLPEAGLVAAEAEYLVDIAPELALDLTGGGF